MTGIQLEVVLEDQTPHKWCVPLKEDVFAAFMAKGGPMVHKVFGDKSLFGPLLFKKFFDPSDAFPLWEFEPGLLLSDLQNPCVDWFQTDGCYILKSELPKLEKISIQVYVDNGKVMEISGLWKHKGESRAADWRSGKWWEHGFVRRLELPENTDWKKIEAYVNNDTILDIRLPKTSLECNVPRGNLGVLKESTSAST
ncbi:HSP20-like chaperones superfamily protein [Artemisia annua]|uniref:HSP20-like chaperones superfamily protein n=1 Tax=Artemisia annua TaxID=35608 RepID=A0A2U1LKF3_ARTAN|nr:HSP20-like chaperones superfamily protein [Artemisia annua]